MTSGKLVDREALGELGERLRREGLRVVHTNGCFDLLHVGHLRYLQEARRLGDVLVVSVNSDNGVRRLKGPARPLVPETERAEMLSGLACVDYVTIFPEAEPSAVILDLRPHLHVKGGDYDPAALPETAAVLAAGGEVRILGLTPGRSSSALAQALQLTASACSAEVPEAGRDA